MGAFEWGEDYLSFSSSVLTHRRFIRSEGDKAFLQAVLVSTKSHLRALEPALTVWRAQVGHEERVNSEVSAPIARRIEVPLPAARMKPQRDKAKEGRANAKGIPVLYAAEEKDTVIAEVRPWIGALVTVALLRVNKRLLIIDCTMDQPKLDLASGRLESLFDRGPLTPLDRERYAWSEMDDAFAHPVSGVDDRADYAPTQILAETFREAGFSGVAYRSSLGDGLNIALFYPEDADVIERRLVTVTSVTVESWDVGDSLIADCEDPK